MIILQLDSAQLDSIIQDAVRAALTNAQGQAAAPDPNELLTVQQAAEFLRLSVATVYSLISKGELPVMKRRKRCYFSRAELLEYLKAGRKMTKEEAAQKADEALTSTKKGR